MDINIEKLIKKIRDAEIMMNTSIAPESGQIPLGHVNGIDWQLVVTTKEEDFMPRTAHEDAFVPGRRDEYAGSNDFPKTTES